MFHRVLFPDGFSLISVPNAHNLERALHSRSLLGPQHRNAIGVGRVCFRGRGLSNYGWLNIYSR